MRIKFNGHFTLEQFSKQLEVVLKSKNISTIKNASLYFGFDNEVIEVSTASKPKVKPKKEAKVNTAVPSLTRPSYEIIMDDEPYF